MTISFEITNDLKKDYKKETERYINLIENLKKERDMLIRKHSAAFFSGDKSSADCYLLKISANSLLADAYKLGLKALKMEMGV